MQDLQKDIDVLIVGAGPVGLFLANECARRGLSWRLVESRAGQSEHSKALAIFPRTLEIFDMAGLVAPFLEAANRVTAAVVVSHGRTLARLRFEPETSPYPFIAMVPQNLTERLLVQELARQGGSVEYQTTFVSAEQGEHGVTATLDHQGDRQTLRAACMVGCDGARSAVRHLLDLPLEGGEYQATFMLADVETNRALPADELQLCPSEDGPVAIFPMSPDRDRIVAMIDKPEGDAPSLELSQRILRERGPKGIEAHALHWSSYFHIHHRQVTRLGVGRIFLAGDAAHLHSPFGGQGMNTGLQDAWNLVWKLDLVLRGRAGWKLLDSYGAERLPVIRQVVTMTDLLTRAMATPNRLAQALRDTVIPMVSHLSPFQHALVNRLSELGIAYGGSPIVEGPGKRYLEDSMRGGKGIVSRFLLLLGPDNDAATRDAAGLLCQTFPGVVESRPSLHRGITLVRPDGYIAYAGSGGEALLEVRSVLGKQTLGAAEVVVAATAASQKQKARRTEY